jgi:oligosaccharide reducing-end xylanase
LRRSRPSPLAALLVPALAVALSACDGTTDSLGYDGIRATDLGRLTPPATYPNVLHDWLGKSQTEIDAKITATWNQLFYGDASTQAIYFPVGTDKAEIRDTFHNNDIRTEGFGYAMMIAVQLDKRTEFDRMWTYVKSTLSYPMTNPNGGYFQSSCDSVPPAGPVSCNDPFGHGQFVTALLFARDRWGILETHDYAADAAALLDVMRHKEDINGGIVNDVTNTFDMDTALAYDVPEVQAAGVSRPSVVMPAFYELWGQATKDPFWTRAATAARAYWKRAAHPTTGLFPSRAKFDGTPIENWDTFDSESFRAQINMALDWIWFAREPWEIENADRMLTLFTSKGMTTYGGEYRLDGIMLNSLRDYALIAANGPTAMISTHVNKKAYVTDVWNMAIQTGPARYFSGLLHLTALLILSGQYKVL